MTLMTKILFVFIVMTHFSSFVHAEVKNLNDVMSKATPQELKDLPKLLKQIRMKRSGKSMMTVTTVEKGSVYDREGIKVGDLISIAKSNSPEKPTEQSSNGIVKKIDGTQPKNPQEAMELYQKMNAEKATSEVTDKK